MAELIGRVAAIAIRPPGTPAPRAQATVQALAGAGLEGDRHADPLSPRQVLLASKRSYTDLALPEYALRENLLLDTAGAPFVSSTVLQIGEHALLRLMFLCEACGQLDLVRPGLAGLIGAGRGMLARVIRSGAMHVGDTVRDLGPLLPPWSDDWRERVLHVLSMMPDGAVVEYARLARLAGVDASYCRAFPRLLARCGLTSRAIPAKSVVATPRWHGDGLFADEAGLHLPT